MQTLDPQWEARVAALWECAQSLSPDELVRAANALADELEPDDSRALFERACARDRAVEAAGLALCTLAPYLSRYSGSVAGNAAALVQKTWS